MKLRAFSAANPANAPLTRTEDNFSTRERELVVQSWKYAGKLALQQ
jgi:hypothetical protein